LHVLDASIQFSSTPTLQQLLRLSVHFWCDKCGASLTIFRSQSLLVKPPYRRRLLHRSITVSGRGTLRLGRFHGPCQSRVSGTNWKSEQGYAARTDLLYGKGFSKRIGSGNGQSRLGQGNVVMQRLRKLHANGLLCTIKISHRGRDEAARSVIVGNFAPPCSSEYKLPRSQIKAPIMETRRIKSGASSEQVWRANVAHAGCSGGLLSAGFHVPIRMADDKGQRN
jgi:hypothetical protein